MAKKLLYDYSEDLTIRRLIEESKKALEALAEEAGKLDKLLDTKANAVAEAHWRSLFTHLSATGNLQGYVDADDFINRTKRNVLVDEETNCIFTTDAPERKHAATANHISKLIEDLLK